MASRTSAAPRLRAGHRRPAGNGPVTVTVAEAGVSWRGPADGA
ncbi:hypothetical protein AB0J90_26060 [Micromonospora sp. NPDC049523]